MEFFFPSHTDVQALHSALSRYVSDPAWCFTTAFCLHCCLRQWPSFVSVALAGADFCCGGFRLLLASVWSVILSNGIRRHDSMLVRDRLSPSLFSSVRKPAATWIFLFRLRLFSTQWQLTALGLRFGSLHGFLQPSSAMLQAANNPTRSNQTPSLISLGYFQPFLFKPYLDEPTGTHYPTYHSYMGVRM